jgi:acyl-CoA thioesterase-1
VAKWLVKQPFAVMVLETGANDMLRGTSPGARCGRNVQSIVDTVRRRARTRASCWRGWWPRRTWVPSRTRASSAPSTPTRRRRTACALIPFLLDGVAGNPDLNLGDGIHPNERGQRIVAQNVWRVLEPVLREESGRAARPEP